MSSRKPLKPGDLAYRYGTRDDERRPVMKVIGDSGPMYQLHDISDGADGGTWHCYRYELQRVVMTPAGPVCVDED